MIRRYTFWVTMLFLLFAFGCKKHYSEGTFGYDQNFLNSIGDVVTLESDDGKGQIVVLPALQGRVMTSTSNGLEGNSYGWLNYELFASGEFVDQINPFGGEDRFWIGPEGGQFSIFFENGSDFSFEDWNTPAAIDTEPFGVINQTKKEIVLQQQMKLKNYSNFIFNIEVNRTVSIFEQNQIEKELNLVLDGVDFVGYESNNEIKNIGKESWTKETGLLSIWILGMFNPSENTKIILPYKDSLVLNTAYFGEVPEDRITITDKHVMFSGDGKYRSKLGLPPHNALPFIGSYDADMQMLTVVNYTFEGDTTYVNSMWELQDNPYGGDVVNTYNDGPLDNGDQLGPFYELETSSSAKELQPGGSIRHISKTYHFEGEFEALSSISKQLLGKNLGEL